MATAWERHKQETYAAGTPMHEQSRALSDQERQVAQQKRELPVTVRCGRCSFRAKVPGTEAADVFKAHLEACPA